MLLYQIRRIKQQNNHNNNIMFVSCCNLSKVMLHYIMLNMAKDDRSPTISLISGK